MQCTQNRLFIVTKTLLYNSAAVLGVNAASVAFASLGTATACISEVAPGVQYGATWTEVEEPPGNRKPKGAINARVNVPFWLPRCPFSFAVWPPHRLQANCGLQRANCVSCDEPITWRERLS